MNGLPLSHLGRNQRGNVIFILLIAVVLLGALSFAITQTQRGSTSQVTDENARLLATEIIDYSNTVANAVGQLRLRGVAETALCFDSPQWPVDHVYAFPACDTQTNRIFSPDGGGVIWARPTALAFDPDANPSGLWEYVVGNEVTGIGTDGLADDNVDLLMILTGLNFKVCHQINKLLQVENPDAESTPVVLAYAEHKFTGSYTAAQAIDDSAGGGKLFGKKSGCFNSLSPSNNYVFYRVLQAR